MFDFGFPTIPRATSHLARGRRCCKGRGFREADVFALDPLHHARTLNQWAEDLPDRAADRAE